MAVGTCASEGSGTQGRGVRTKLGVAPGSLRPWSQRSPPETGQASPLLRFPPGPAPGTQRPSKHRSYLSSSPSYRAAGGGGRRRGLPALQSNSLVRLLRLSLSGSAPRTSSSCTSGVRKRLKRHCARDSDQSGSGRGVVAGLVPVAPGGLGERPVEGKDCQVLALRALLALPSLFLLKRRTRLPEATLKPRAPAAFKKQ